MPPMTPYAFPPSRRRRNRCRGHPDEGPGNTLALRLDQVVWLTVLSVGAGVGRIMKAARVSTTVDYVANEDTARWIRVSI
jgi:hypothetical protein